MASLVWSKRYMKRATTLQHTKNYIAFIQQLVKICYSIFLEITVFILLLIHWNKERLELGELIQSIYTHHLIETTHNVHASNLHDVGASARISVLFVFC